MRRLAEKAWAELARALLDVSMREMVLDQGVPLQPSTVASDALDLIGRLEEPRAAALLGLGDPTASERLTAARRTAADAIGAVQRLIEAVYLTPGARDAAPANYRRLTANHAAALEAIAAWWHALDDQPERRAA